jgi:hypothetical protein
MADSDFWRELAKEFRALPDPNGLLLAKFIYFPNPNGLPTDWEVWLADPQSPDGCKPPHGWAIHGEISRSVRVRPSATISARVESLKNSSTV